MSKPRHLFPATLLLALVFGAALLWLDTRPHWDDTGIEVGLILVASGVCGFIHPRHAWLWALAVGGWISGRGLMVHHDPTLLVLLLIAFLGAYAGAGVRRSVRKLGQTP